MRVVLMGFGNVGRAFIQLLNNKKKFLENNGISLEVISIFSSKGCIYNPGGFPIDELMSIIDVNKNLEDSPSFSSQIDIDYVIENGGVDTAIIITPTNIYTGEPGLTYITKFLSKGINVVTGDKGPILLEHNKLKALAKENSCDLYIGCTTGGALPAINAGIFDIAGSEVLEIQGIFNGTSNYIINEMEENNLSFEESLKKAQALGIAESNPSLDIEGYDTATKLVIIYNSILNDNKALKDVKISGIKDITKEQIQIGKLQNYKYKLVGRAKQVHKKWELSVSLQKIYSDDSFFNVDGKNKAVKYTTDTLGDITIMGGASGTIPAAASLLRDIVNMKNKIN